ncbi:hypothetical protein EDB85DRAFT_2160251 [Lactarius pseudohatsudake]|nr:hypothetical protein EDB85DRAFT_2160251 [Lactarius pseudohatsudake]
MFAGPSLRIMRTLQPGIPSLRPAKSLSLRSQIPTNVTTGTLPTADNTSVQRDENHGDSSDGLWSMYLTEAEKQDKEVTETWKGDTDGILVFVSPAPLLVRVPLIRTYPDSGDTTNALLTQISGQLFNISNGIPLTSVGAQSSQPFKPTASAVRVNVLWFLSLVLSLNCALSVTLMQQWARRYQELAQRRGAAHRRGRMRAYIFDGITKFEMAQAVATMPRLLHISVFLFFAGLVDFLFPIYATVAYATLGCISVFSLAYAILTVLPNIFLDCPYATPLSGYTWRISQFFVIVFLKTILEIRKFLSKIWSWINQQAPESHRHQKWRKILDQQVKTRQQWFSQGIRKSVELSAYRADSTVVTSALVWTLAALDEDKEIEDFAARVPGFFDSRVVQDATMAVLPLMSHQPNTDPIFGSRLYDLLKTCIPETSILDKQVRKNRLRVCMKCLWYFGRAYNQLGSPQVLPSYIPDTLASPEITRRVRAEEDIGVRVLGRCFEALVVNKLAADIDSRTVPVTNAEFACLSAILDTEDGSVGLLLRQPGAVIIANMISFKFDEVSTLVANTIPSDVLDLVQQTLGILTQVLPTQESAAPQLDQPNAMTNVSNGGFERVLLSRLHDLLKTCTAEDSHLTEEVRTCYLRMCLKGLWYVVQAFNKHGNSVPLLSHICIIFSDPEMASRMREQGDHSVRMMVHCVCALVVNELATDIHSRTVPVSDTELTCLSSILDIKGRDVAYLLHHPGAVQFTNMIFFMMSHHYKPSWTPTSSSLDVVQQTFGVLSQAPSNSKILDPTDTLMSSFDGTSSDPHERRKRVFGMLKSLWHFARAYIELGNSISLPSYFYIVFTYPVITRRILDEDDITVDVIRRCIGALVVNKLATDINARALPVNDEELACLSSILGTDGQDVTRLLSHPGAIQFVNMIFLVKKDIFVFPFKGATSGIPDVVRQTFSILSRALPAQLNKEMWLDPKDILMHVSKGTSFPYVMHRRVLGMCLTNLWHFTRAYIERGNSVPLPSYVYIAFTHPKITRRMHEEGDVAAHVLRRCVEALIVNKLATDINGHTHPVSDAKLGCLSSILDSERRDVRLCLTQPGVLGLVNLAPFVLGPVGCLKIDNLPLESRNILQQTLGILSHPLLARLKGQLQQDKTTASALFNISDDRFERPVVSRLHGFLKTCIPGASESHFMEAIRTSCLRMCLKTLWHSGKAYHHNSDPLPPYFPLMLASPEIIHHFQTEQDPVARLTGCCFGALIVSKLVDAFTSPILLSGHVKDAELACISAILGIEHHEVLLSPHQLRIINFQKVVSLLSGEIDILFTMEGTPASILGTAQDTLHDLANRLFDSRFGFKDVPGDQQRLLLLLLLVIHKQVENAVRSDSGRHKDQMVKILKRLRKVLEKLLSVGPSQNTAMED